jgi:hypothetical protein
MIVNAGVWVDNLKALVVIIFDGGEKKLEIQADAGPQPGQLTRFYNDVTQVLRDAESILIYGPGKAKDELRAHLQRARLQDKVLGVEAAEAMTDPQFMARVRERFQLLGGRLGTA